MNKYYPYLVTICNKDYIDQSDITFNNRNIMNQCLIKANSAEEASRLIKSYVDSDFEIVSVERYKLQMIEV